MENLIQFLLPEEIRKIIDAGDGTGIHEPRGKFITVDAGVWTAVDNLTYDAWTEDFSCPHAAVKWLRNGFENAG